MLSIPSFPLPRSCWRRLGAPSALCAMKRRGGQSPSASPWVCLALTKAAFFSVGIAFILLLLLLDRRKLVRRNDAPSRQLRAAYAALVLAFLATLAPWVVRNAISLGRPEMIAGRGEGILGLRMILTELPPLGLLYASSPPPLMEKLGPLLGYSPADLEPGGKLNVVLTHLPQWGIFDERMKAEGYEGTTEQWLRRTTLLSAVKSSPRLSVKRRAVRISRHVVHATFRLCRPARSPDLLCLERHIAMCVCLACFSAD